MSRIKTSLGQCHFNDGAPLLIPQGKYEIDYSRRFYLFDVIPFGAVRLTQSDKWKTNPNHLDPKKRQRESVTRYYAFKDAIRLQANMMKLELADAFEAVYLIPMPDSWSDKKKERKNKTICQVKPDTDNITKAIKDTLKKSDSSVWCENAQKRWAYHGSIIIYQ